MKIKIHLLRMLIACAVAAGLMFGAAACGGGGDSDDAPAQEDTQPNDPSTDTPGGGTDDPSTDTPGGGTDDPSTDIPGGGTDEPSTDTPNVSLYPDCGDVKNLRVGQTCRVLAGRTSPKPNIAGAEDVFVDATVLSVNRRAIIKGEEEEHLCSESTKDVAPMYEIPIKLKNLSALDLSALDVSDDDGWTLIVTLRGPDDGANPPSSDSAVLDFGPLGAPNDTQLIADIKVPSCIPPDQLKVVLYFNNSHNAARFAVGGS